MGRLVTGNGQGRQWDLSETLIEIVTEEAYNIAVSFEDVDHLEGAGAMTEKDDVAL
jgi:hypothetical protein